MPSHPEEYLYKYIFLHLEHICAQTSRWSERNNSHQFSHLEQFQHVELGRFFLKQFVRVSNVTIVFSQLTGSGRKMSEELVLFELNIEHFELNFLIVFFVSS